MRTHLSNTTQDAFSRHVAELYERHRTGRIPVKPDLQPAAEKLDVSLTDVSHYAQALARWTAAGFPARDQAEVERIELELCKTCEKYTDGRCKKCGCRVTASSLAVVNKIKMATEHCPMEKW